MQIKECMNFTPILNCSVASVPNGMYFNNGVYIHECGNEMCILLTVATSPQIGFQSCAFVTMNPRFYIEL
jgi:hypothetical protein